MKKRLLTILITSLVMIGLLGGFVWKMKGLSGKMAKVDKEKIEEEKDINCTKKMKDSISSAYVKHLYMSGPNKNVITMQYHDTADIYKTRTSDKTYQMMRKLKKSSKYTTDDMLWAYDLYGTNKNGLYVYFQSNGSCYCRYTISVADKTIPDFTRTLRNGKKDNVSEQHEYQIIGLVPGRKNYIIMKLYNKKNQLSDTITYDIEVPSAGKNVPVKLSAKTGNSHSEVSNGLNIVFHKGISYTTKKNKIVKKKIEKNGRTLTKRVRKTIRVTKKNNSLLCYDNSGVLRAQIPVQSDNGRNIQKIYDDLVYVCAKNKIASVNRLGRVVKVYKTYGYTDLGEFDYDGAGNLYTIASAVAKSKVNHDKVLKVNLETAQTQEILSMKKVFPSIYAEAVRSSGTHPKNWIDLNSIQVTGVNQMLLGSAKLSTIVKVSNAGSLMPRVDYIIADQKLYNGYSGLKNKVLQKKYGGVALKPKVTPRPTIKTIFKQKKVAAPDPFTSQYGQNALNLTPVKKGTYYLSMLNNNSRKGSKGRKTSYFYKYLVKEGAKNYILQDRVKCSYMPENGDIQEHQNNLICAVGKGKSIVEMDDKGKLIRKFHFPGKMYRVWKYDGKKLWFY